MSTKNRMFAVVLLVAAPVVAQTPFDKLQQLYDKSQQLCAIPDGASSFNRTSGAFNGRMWLDMGNIPKMFFVWGYLNAIPHAVRITGQQVFGHPPSRSNDKEAAVVTKALVELMPDTPIRDIMDFLDTFFQASENRSLTVGDGILIFAMKVNGKPGAEIEDSLREMRSRAAAFQQDR
jgi:hypothetical protein